MTARNAGSAFVKIRPDAKDFIRDVRRDLAAAKDPGFVIDVSANTSQAAADVRRFREVESRKGVHLGVDVALGQADADLKAFRSRQQANGLTVKVDADTGKAQREIAALRRQMGGIGDLRSAMAINLGAAGISGLPAAAAGLAQVATAIQQVAQAGLALPGIFGGATASISTLAIGLSGVTEAYEAVSQAADDSGRTGVAASNRLRNAVADEAQARKDVARATRDARQQLEDLNVEMRGGLLSESRAILQLQQAQERLASGNYTDRRDAILDEAEAQQHLLEVRTRNAEKAEQLKDVNAKGIAGSDQVVAANERMARSQQAVADAAGGMSAAQQKANDAMAKLAPNAREFVNTLRDLTPVASELRTSIQEIGFDGLAGRLDETVRKLMPTLKTGLSGIARGWNENFEQLFTSIGSDSSKGLLDRILGNTADAQSRLTAAIDPIVHGVGILTAAGTDSLPRLADAIDNVADRFDRFITAADKDGRLEKWINDGITAVGHLGETAINLGKTWTAITKAAGGEALLGNIEQLTSRLQTFLNSTEGQDKLRKFFDEGRETLAQWLPILQNIPSLFQGIYEGAQTYIGGALEVIGPLVRLLADHPGLVQTAIAAWVGWKTIGPIMSGVQNTLGAFSTALTNVGTGFAPVRDKAKAAMGEVDDIFDKAGRSDSKMGKFASAVAGLSVAGGPLGLLVTAGLPLVAQFASQFGDDMDDAADHLKAVNQEAQKLIGTLERVTNMTGLGTRKAVAEALQSGRVNGAPDKGLGGDALAALMSLGLGGQSGQDAITAALPGGDDQYEKIMGQLRDKVRPEVQKFIKDQGWRLQDLGIDENTIIDAWLSVPSALDKIRSLQGAGGNFVDLGRLYEQINTLGPNSDVYKASLGGQRLNDQRSGSDSAVQKAQAAQAAAVPQPKLRPEFANLFPNAVVNTDGNQTTIVSTVPPDMQGSIGNAVNSALDPNTQAEQGVPPNEDKWTYRLSPEDARKFTYAKGGPTPAGLGPLADGGYPAVIHPQEWMLNRHGRSVLGDDFLAAANAGRIDMSKLPKFDGGGLVDPNGNPVTAGAAPGAPIAAPVAPNPTASGGLSGIFGQIVSGMNGPIGNALSLGNSLMNMGSTPASGTDLGQTMAARASQVPGLVGLFGSMAGPNPEAAVQNWGTQAASYTANWAVDTLGEAGSILGNGVLAGLGLDNSILSGSNPWNQAISQTAQFALGGDGPVSSMLGLGGNTGGGGSITDPAALAAQYDVTIDPATGQLTTSHMATDAKLTPEFLSTLPGHGGEDRLQINTIRAKRAIEAAFPEIKEIGGYREDAMKWHPNGLAIDVMIPGQGGLNDPTTPAGKALGDRIYQYVMAHKDELGVDYVLWQQKDHYNHLHVNTVGGGYPKVPGMFAGGPTPSGYGPVDSKGGHLAVIHPREYMISARGRASVPDSFLHALNAGIVDPSVLPKYFDGGPPQGYVKPTPPPRPNVVAQQKAVPAPKPAQPVAPARPVTPLPAPEPTQSPVASQMPYTAPQITAPTQPGPAPSSINHNLPALSKGISSAASAIGQAISTAVGLAGGAAGGVGGGAMGALGSYAGGLATQGGKVVDAAVNVVSSALVGSVPGSFGDPNMPAFGSTLRPEQNRPVTAEYRSNGATYNISGHNTDDVIRAAQNQEALARQARLANYRI